MPETVTFDHYEVLTRDDGSLYELGRGAMGITYKAFDTNLRVPVALKVINCANLNTDIARQRFVREARSAAKLRHRHVASVFHLGAEGDTYFYAMEFIDGETVEALIKRQGAIPPVLALRIALQVARALNAATQHGLVHRDIKPSNLMLVHEDDEVVVKVIDFGLAKSCVGEEDVATISMGGFVGTPHFASPEQLEDAEIDVRSDIYSLGVTLWYLLAGHTPFAGSMAQVMSQHLTKQPPFEKLTNIPPALSALLRRMLAKRPDDRFQTPNELRQEIEKCIESVSAAPIGAGAVPVTKIDEETFATVLDETHQTVEPTQFEVGSLVAGRYEIRQALGETNAGRMFHAYDQEQKIDVRMLVLLRDFTDDTNLYTQLEREVNRIVPVQHANLLRVYGMETVVPSSFVVVEWTEGFTLLELLRARRELGIEETLAILKQAAAGLDFAISAGLKRVDLALHQIFVDFGQNAQGREHWMRTPITEWPAFRVKLNPLGITRELSASETWAGGQTVVGGAAPLPDRSTQDDSRGVFIASLASIIYELLGGALSPLGPGGAATMRYTPLAGLSEEGNGVVKRAMAPASNAFPTAEAFARELGAVEERRIGLGAKKPDSRPAFPTKTSVPPTPAVTPPAAVARPRHRIPVGFIGGIATVATIATLLFLFLRSAPAPRTTTGAPPTPGGTPASSPTIATSTPTPPQIVVAATPVPPTPAPTPARQDYLKAAITSAEVLETSGNRERAIRGWLKLIKQFPETDIGKVRLEMMLNNLRRDGESMSDEEFSAIREALTEAAHQDILAAQMLLGQELRERSPVDSFNWYSAAAAQGNAAALTQLGLMLSNGTGTQPDLEKAVACFQAAADQDEPAAQGALAECYLYGKGVEKDEKKAIGLLKEASDRGNVRAMNRLGTCYHQGVGVAQNFPEAYQLFKRASEMGYGEAMGNLGVLYINGEGVSRNPRKAVELFQKGAKAEDSYCMFLLARCYESGTGISANKLEAQNWYRRAAEAGHPRAAEWCAKNDVPFKKPD